MRVITIGRDIDNDIVLKDPSISRHHTQIIVHDDNSISISDMGSANGTFVNGTRIDAERYLRKNDTVRLGSVDFDWKNQVKVNNRKPAGSVKSSSTNNLLIILLACTTVVLGVLCIALSVLNDKKIDNLNAQIVELESINRNAERKNQSLGFTNQLTDSANKTHNEKIKELEHKSNEERLSHEKATKEAKRELDSIVNTLQLSKKDQTAMAESIKTLNGTIDELKKSNDQLASDLGSSQEELSKTIASLNEVKSVNKLLTDNLDDIVDILIKSVDEKDVLKICIEDGYMVPEDSKAKTVIKDVYREANLSSKLDIYAKLMKKYQNTSK